ncbi:MAG: hypothetical protein JSV99_10275 [Planctomycetota bacterium]|nr:MAG: hypothetical protein JSV99_10275 [Planctomycetota bacterium]
MRKLRRARQEHARERKKFRRRAVAAGTAAAITLGAGEEFVRPRRGPYRGRQEKSAGMRWLMKLTMN